MRLTIDDILSLHDLFLLLLQEVIVNRQTPGIRLKVLLSRLKITHQLVVDHFSSWGKSGDGGGGGEARRPKVKPSSSPNESRPVHGGKMRKGHSSVVEHILDK